MNPFSSQLERLARTLTDQFGVTVFCKGDLAYTDGRRIVLPSLPEPMDSQLERMIVGYLDHEMSHVAFTDFNEVRRFVNKHPGFEDLLNAVEDALIEKRAMQRWPGVRANLDALFHQVRPRVLKSLAAAPPFHRFAVAVYLKLCHHKDLLGLDGDVAGFDDLLDEFPAVRTTRDTARLSSKLLKRWLQRMTSQKSQTPSTPPPTGTETPAESDAEDDGEPDKGNPSRSEESKGMEADDGSPGSTEQADPDHGDEDSVNFA